MAPDGDVLLFTDQALWRLAPDGTLTQAQTYPDVPTLFGPAAVAVDAGGSIYVGSGDRVERIDPDGTVTRILDATGDGVDPFGAAGEIVVDGATGDVLVADVGLDQVFRVRTDGTVQRILDRFTGPLGILFREPRALAVDSRGNVYAAGRLSWNVFRVTPAGDISLVMDVDGDGLGHTLVGPRSLGVDGADNLYVQGLASADSPGDKLFRVTPGGAVSLVLDTSAGAPPLESFDGLLVADDGTLVVAGTRATATGADEEARVAVVSRVLPDGVVETLLDEASLCRGEGTYLPVRLAGEADGTVYAQTSNGIGPGTSPPGGRVFRSVAAGDVDVLFDGERLVDTVWALAPFDTGRVAVLRTGWVDAVGPDGADQTLVRRQSLLCDGRWLPPREDGVARTTDGAVWVWAHDTDDVDHLLRRDPSGALSRVDLPPPVLSLQPGAWGPLAASPDGSLIVGDRNEHVVHRVSPGGDVRTVLDRDGDGAGHTMFFPDAIAAAPDGTVYVASGTDYVFRVAPDGAVDVVLDLDALPFFAANPEHLALADDGRLFVACRDSKELLVLLPGGAVEVAHDPVQKTTDLAVDAWGEAYYVDPGFGDLRVQRVAPDGTVSDVFVPADHGYTDLELDALLVDDLGTVWVTGEMDDGDGLLFRVSPEGALADLGGETPQPDGRRVALAAACTFGAGDPFELSVVRAPRNSLLVAWMAVAPTPMDVLGGTLEAFPFVAQRLFATDGLGRTRQVDRWPPGVPPGTEVTVQALVADASAPQGIVLSNAVRATTP